MKKNISRKAAMAVAAAYLMSLSPLPVHTAAAADFDICALTLNYQSEPIGIAAEGIRFGWRASSSLVGFEQEAYEIEVSDKNGVVWSSGRVDDGRSVGIPYGDEPLESMTRYTWNVKVWDKSGAMRQSESSAFETAAQGVEEWEKAEFIRMPESASAPIFRAEKAVEGELESARLYITALGVYSAEVNGEKVYKIENGKKVYHHMNPGYGNGADSIEYETYDVTELIGEADTAVLTVTAGIGWNNGTADGVLGSTSGTPAVKAMLRMVYTDGSEQYLTTDTHNWRATLLGPVTRHGIYYGEDYDARRLAELGDYTSADYDDSGWTAAESADETPYILENSFEPAMVKYLRLSVSQTGPATANDNENRLQIMELEALGNGHNYALGATASASNSFSYGSQWRTSNINDGIYGTVNDSGYTTEILGYGGATFTPASPITVDLTFSEAVKLDSIRLYCRTALSSVGAGLCPNYPKVYSVLLSEDGKTWTEAVKDYDAGNVRNTVLNADGITSTEYGGEIQPSSGMSGKIVDEFEQHPVSAVIYTGTKAVSEYAGGEIEPISEYSGADMFDGGVLLKDGQTMVVNMGQNLTAIPEISFSAASGVRANMKFAEMLNDGSAVGSGRTDASGPKGSIYTKSLRGARSEAEYTFAGSGEEIYQPSMSFFGYQYVQIIALGGDITITGLRSRALSSVSRQTGKIETNNKDVNRLFLNALYGQLSNFYTIPTDCPQRDERLAWTGDAQAFARTAMYNFDSAAFLEGWQDILSENTLKYGYPAAVTSLAGYFNHWGTGWSDVQIVNAYSWYTSTGDTAFLEENWAALNAYMDYMRQNERAPYRAPRVHVRSYGDWLAFQGTCESVIADYYYGYVTSLMIELAEAVGDSEKAEYYKSYF